jgi:hypothetical protein
VSVVGTVTAVGQRKQWRVSKCVCSSGSSRNNNNDNRKTYGVCGIMDTKHKFRSEGFWQWCITHRITVFFNFSIVRYSRE